MQPQEQARERTPRVRICCCAVAEPTVKAAAGQLCFKFVYFLNMLAVPIFLIWMVVATRPVDQRIFGVENNKQRLGGDANSYTGSVQAVPTSLEGVHEWHDCGETGSLNWDLQAIATKPLAGGTVPVVLASTGMTSSNQEPPDSPKLSWHAVAQPRDFGDQVSLSGPSYETDVLRGIGCHSTISAADYDTLKVCVSSGNTSLVDSCDLVSATFTGGLAGWLTQGRKSGVTLHSPSGGTSLIACPLQPKGICLDPEDAVDCRKCKTFACKPGTNSHCDRYTLDDCTAKNNKTEQISMPPLQIFIQPGGVTSDNYTKIASQAVSFLLGKGAERYWSSKNNEPQTSLKMSGTMQATASPKWCFGPRLQSLYLVVCLTPSSGSNGNRWHDHQPPEVDGPPFNDRCSALYGLCGTAGVPPNLPPEWCSPDGTIPMGMLVRRVTGHRNPTSSAWVTFWFAGFVLFMVLAHVSTLVTYFGGLFRTDYIDDAAAVGYGRSTRCAGWDQLKRHKDCMGQLGAIVVWGASKSEERLFILRNWVGRAAAVPHWDDDGRSGTGPDWRGDSDSSRVNDESVVLGRMCNYVDVFMDEGHRAGAKDLWEAWVAFLQTRPPRSFLEELARRLEDFSFDDAKSTGRGQKGDPFNGLNHLLPQTVRARNPYDSLRSQHGHAPAASSSSVEEVPLGEHNPYASFEERAVPLRERRDEEAPDSDFEETGAIFGEDLSAESVQKFCNLTEVFRDENVTENLEPKHPVQEGEERYDITEDVVVQRRVEFDSGSTEYLYVARARERRLPPAPCRVLAQQHMACLHLPSRHEESPVLESLPHLVKRLAGLLYVVKAPFHLANRTGVSVQASTVWRRVVKVMEEGGDLREEGAQPSTVVRLEWFAARRDGTGTGVKRGQVERAQLQDRMIFQPLVPGCAELSPWEIGRRCTGTVVELAADEVTLDSLNPLLEWLSYDPEFISRTNCRQQQGTRMIQLERRLAKPLCGSRGKGGAQNDAVSFVRGRGLLEPLARDDLGAATPSYAVPSYQPDDRQCPPVSMGCDSNQSAARPSLFTIVDARHMLKPEFFQKVLPTFYRRVGGSYSLDERVAFAQVPQTFSQIEVVDDSLDVNNNMMFSMLNTIRNNCGAVTSCGTNSTWQLPPNGDEEFFDARTKIEDTASSHRAFQQGKRSVYVKDRCVKGIAKRNARYLGAVARWSEGGVQLQWVTFLLDRAMLPVLACKLGYMFLIFAVVLFFHFKPQDKYLFCPGGPTAGLCGRLTRALNDPTGQCISVFEGAIVWTVLAFVVLLLFELARATWGATAICRRVVMLDNLTYFWSTSAAFFWVLLNGYMIISGSIPFSYEITGWMYWLIVIKSLQYILTYSMKFKGDCQEASIWRAQQMFFVTAPLHLLSIILGTKGAFDIWRGVDKSFWDTDNWAQVLCLVRAWLSFIIGATVAALVVVPLAIIVNPYNVTPAELSATVILVFMGITVFDAFMDVWDLTAKVQHTAKINNATGVQKCWVWICRVGISFRKWAWLVRWLMDFGMPILVLLILKESSFGIAAAFSFLARL